MHLRKRLFTEVTGVFMAGVLSVAFLPAAAFAGEGTEGDASGSDAATDTSTATGTATAATDADAIDDELIVTYKADSSIKSIVKKSGVDSEGTEKLADDADGSDISLVSLDGSQASDEAISALESDPRVESVERNHKIRALATSVNDYFAATYPRYSYYLQTENIESAWNVSKANGDVTVAVLDSGVTMDTSYRDPDLESTVDYSDAYDAIRGRKLSSSFKDTCGHGTAVSELVAAQVDNGEGIAGVSYDAKVLPVRVIDSSGEGDLADLITGYSHVLDVASELNVKVISMSLGSDSKEGTESLQKLIDEAYDRGILSVAASGNEAQEGNPVEYPASLDHVVSVGAVNRNGRVAAWSEHNSHVDLVAAGVDLAVPSFWNEDYMSGLFDPGRDPWSPGRSTTGYYYTADTYAIESGTSFAAPIVSGVAALLYAYDPTATAAEVENALEASATDRGTSGRDDYYGHGELNATAALSELASAKQRVSAESAKVTSFKASQTKIVSKTRGKKSVKVKWNKIANASGYRVYYRVAGKKSWKKVTTTKKTVTVKNLKRKTKYEVRVRGYLSKLDGTKAWSKYSPTVTVKTK